MPVENKYDDEGFVGMFILRQYGPLVKMPEVPRCSFDSRLFSRISENRYGGEVFYQSLLNMASPYLHDRAVVVDIGCGAGRLTGEFARKGVKFALGMDYSPLMVTVARRVILGQRGKTMSFRVRTSRMQLREATISEWGMKNCGFVIADAQMLPLQKDSIDLIACVNLLHRVKNPKKVVQEIERVIKPDGILLMSNSYDWSKEYTPEDLWFDDVSQVLDRNVWSMDSEIDGVPYTVGMHNRKLSLTFNHIQIFQKGRSQKPERSVIRMKKRDQLLEK